MSKSSIHPAAVASEQLLADCEASRLRRSGPGGQHRNKVETAVRLRHLPTGVQAEASERRSQAQNQQEALFRLRVNLALEVRAAVDHEPAPSPLWQSRCAGARLKVSADSDDFPALLAEALDVVSACDADANRAAALLGCTMSQLIRLLKLDHRALALVNRWRAQRELHALREKALAMKHLPVAISLLACLAIPAWTAECLAEKPPADARPNIIFFLVDDMGWQDTSVPFWIRPTPLNKKFHTPNMEKLAAEGMKFTQAYASCVCSPSRVSLMTGLNAMRHRVTNWTLYKNKSPDVSNPDLQPPEWNWCGISPLPGLPRTVYVKPLPMFLRAAGYRTIHVGKAHFGAVGTIGEDPLKLGFDVNIAGHAAGGPGSYLSEDEYGNNKPGPWGVPGLKQYHHTGVFLTEALTREANKAVDQAVADRKPFYLYMAHYAVHVPYAADPRYYQKYIDAGLDTTEAEYAGLIEGMDQSLGDILANVERHGLTNQTIVLFMSDNGGLSVHGRGGKPNTHNRPLSSGKGSAREGGIREPMIVRWPGVVKPKSTCDTPVIIEDFFPTILQLAGIAPPPHWDSPGRGDEQQPLNVQGIDGVSFLPLLRGAASGVPADRPLFWHYPNCWGPKGPGIGSTSTVRQGDWKLIYYHDPAAKPRYELFNIHDDIGETKNLADTKPDVRDRLADELGNHMRAVAAQMPTDKRTGKLIEYPSSARRSGEQGARSGE